MNDDEKYMARCLQLARCGRAGAAPNPMVGAVIVADGRIIGEGYHIRCGEAHAEVNAISSVQPWDEPLLAQASIYVSLEPCSHYGKTPPCADLIIARGIPRVVVGCIDPFSEVAGRGIRKLREAGIDVTVGVLEQECLALNHRFITCHTEKRPYVILKWAQSADGFIDRLRTSPDEAPVTFSTRHTAMLVHRRPSWWDVAPLCWTILRSPCATGRASHPCESSLTANFLCQKRSACSTGANRPLSLRDVPTRPPSLTWSTSHLTFQRTFFPNCLPSCTAGAYNRCW